VPFHSGVPACLRTGESPRSLALGALVVIALVTALGTPSIAKAPTASADTSATVEVETQRMSDAGLTSRPDGIYKPGDELTLVCSKRGQGMAGIFGSTVAGRGNDLWYQTSDGHFVSDDDIETGTLKVAAPECGSLPPSAASEAAPVTDAGRATGRTQGVNPGTPGQCTWGAAQKWFEASGSYPALLGDAMSWSDTATAAGWTVVDDARDRSIVVFQPGVAGAGSVGHVAWVDSVSERPDGRWIHVTEMNNAYLGGVGIFNDRDIREVPGMSYILLSSQSNAGALTP
jgi:surface antigen